MTTRVPAKVKPPYAFAHRGARALAAENTLEAFTLALRLGATGLESDVWLTADGEAVLEVTPAPHKGCAKFTQRFGRDAVQLVASPEGRALRLRGVCTRVVTPGVVRPGDGVRVLSR